MLPAPIALRRKRLRITRIVRIRLLPHLVRRVRHLPALPPRRIRLDEYPVLPASWWKHDRPCAAARFHEP